VSAEGAASEEPPRAKVAAAKRLVTRGSELIDAHEGKLLALLPLGWVERTFRDESTPTRMLRVGAVDISGAEPNTVGVVDVSWRKVVAQFELAGPGIWQIGVLKRDPDRQNAVELWPPPESLDLDRVALMLGAADLAARQNEPQQLALPTLELPAGETETGTFDEQEEEDDDVPF
jgi:hypothetical protein